MKDKQHCKNPNHKRHVADFVKNYSSAKDRVPNTIIIVDPNYWSIDLEHPSKNTSECCQLCSIAEDIAWARTNMRLPVEKKSLVNVNSNSTKCHPDGLSKARPQFAFYRRLRLIN